jgi:hypothetical protein
MSINASAITGGGYLLFDQEKEQYAGILYLAIKDKIAITAIGLLTTRLPDGRKGFSLLLIITAEFPPIQLGYGFVLLGVGGLIGVNRTMLLDVLRAGIKNKTLDSILFPKNPIANAPKIISDLQAIFPPAEGHFVFGPMAKIAWGGAYPILTIELGILIELGLEAGLPASVRLALLGKGDARPAQAREAGRQGYRLPQPGDHGSGRFRQERRLGGRHPLRLAHRRISHHRRHGDAPELGRRFDLRDGPRAASTPASSRRPTSRHSTAWPSPLPRVITRACVWNPIWPSPPTRCSSAPGSMSMWPTPGLPVRRSWPSTPWSNFPSTSS